MKVENLRLKLLGEKVKLTISRDEFYAGRLNQIDTTWASEWRNGYAGGGGYYSIGKAVLTIGAATVQCDFDAEIEII